MPARPTRPAPASAGSSGDEGSTLIGRTIAGKFLLEAVIGVGGSGTVYRAIQMALDRTVALKLLRPEFARNPHVLERFKREARAASRLDHPNSVRVLDFGQDEDASLYLAMEHVQGPTLYDLISREWPLDDGRIIRLLSQVLSALAVAHDLAVIHRDLKPENIIIVRGGADEDDAEQAKVCDFGIAKLGTVLRDAKGPDQPRVTVDGSFVGTPEYMSPEQVRGQLGDRRSDIYALGVVLYQLLAGRVPFEDPNPWALAFKHTTDQPRPPSSFGPVNSQLEAVCLKAMNKRPEDRYASAREMRAALRACLTTETAPTSPPSRSMVPPAPRSITPARTVVVSRRHRPWPLALAAAITALLVGWTFHRPSPPPPAPPLAAAVPPLPPLPAPTPEPILTPVAEPTPPIPDPRLVRPRPARAVQRPTAVPPPVEPEPEPEPASVPPPPPAPAIAAQPPRPAPVVAPLPLPPPLDPERAAVAITAVTSTSAIPGSNIRSALARAPIQQCYRDALRGQRTAAASTATLNLKIDVTGYVTGAALEGPFPPELKACVEKAARAVRVRDVDTGEVSAAVTLRFTPS